MIDRVATRRNAVRWLLIPVFAISGCGVAAVAGMGASGALGTVFTPEGLEALMPLDAREAIRYFIEAFVFVLAGSWIAPRWRPLVAVLLFALGARLAWMVLGSWAFPEFHPRAYQPSSLPLYGCLAGGLLGVAVASLLWRRRALTQVEELRPAR